MVVGGSAHTVAIGGYTLGGGHSPMSPTFGLAVDNLLEVLFLNCWFIVDLTTCRYKLYFY